MQDLLGPRAGFWRRLVAFALYAVICGVAIGVLAIPVFKISGGALQTSQVSAYTECAPARIPVDLVFDPPLMANRDFQVACRASFLGQQVSRVLTVGRTESVGDRTRIISHSYLLDNDGKPDGHDISLAFQAAGFAALTALIARRGRTLGQQALRVRVVRRDGLGGVGWRRAIMRELARPLVFVIAAAPAVAYGMIRDVASPSPDLAFLATVLFGIAVIATVSIWAIIEIARKRDPFWDRWAGTALVRESYRPSTI